MKKYQKYITNYQH